MTIIKMPPCSPRSKLAKNPEYVCNEKTGRYVKRAGKIGQGIASPRRVSPRRASPKRTPPQDKILNPATGRYVKRDGKIGRALLAQQAPRSASPSPPYIARFKRRASPRARVNIAFEKGDTVFYPVRTAQGSTINMEVKITAVHPEDLTFDYRSKVGRFAGKGSIRNIKGIVSQA